MLRDSALTSDYSKRATHFLQLIFSAHFPVTVMKFGYIFRCWTLKFFAIIYAACLRKSAPEGSNRCSMYESYFIAACWCHHVTQCALLHCVSELILVVIWLLKCFYNIEPLKFLVFLPSYFSLSLFCPISQQNLYWTVIFHLKCIVCISIVFRIAWGVFRVIWISPN